MDADLDGDKFLRKKGVAAMLGVSRHTLSRIMARDPTFPQFIELSPGINMVRVRDVRAWLRGKELAARARTIAATR